MPPVGIWTTKPCLALQKIIHPVHKTKPPLQLNTLPKADFHQPTHHHHHSLHQLSKQEAQLSWKHPMTYEQYLDLKNEYQRMAKQLKRYNEFRASQQGPIASRQYSQRPNLELEQSDSQKVQASSESWKLRYSSTERSSEASEPSSTKRKRRKSHVDQADHATKVDLENVIRELQQLKKV